MVDTTMVAEGWVTSKDLLKDFQRLPYPVRTSARASNFVFIFVHNQMAWGLGSVLAASSLMCVSYAGIAHVTVHLLQLLVVLLEPLHGIRRDHFIPHQLMQQSCFECSTASSQPDLTRETHLKANLKGGRVCTSLSFLISSHPSKSSQRSIRSRAAAMKESA